LTPAERLHSDTVMKVHVMFCQNCPRIFWARYRGKDSDPNCRISWHLFAEGNRLKTFLKTINSTFLLQKLVVLQILFCSFQIKAVKTFYNRRVNFDLSYELPCRLSIQVIIRSKFIRHSSYRIFCMWFRFGGRFNFSDSDIFGNKGIRLLFISIFSFITPCI